MRAIRAAGLLLLAALIFPHAAAAGVAVPDVAPSAAPAALPAASATAQAPSPAAPGHRAPDIDTLPGDDDRGGAGPIGWLLIAAAVILAVIIVGFVIRHHRTGRPG